MSKNAQRATERFSVRRYNAADDFSVVSARAEYDVAERDARQIRNIGTRHVSGEGLLALESAGVAAFEAAARGHKMPHNLITSQSWGNLVVAGYRLNQSAGRRMPTAEADNLIVRAARFGGWLKAAAGLPAVRRLLKKSQSERGINSPYTRLNLRALMARFPSPGGLERALWAVKNRAEAILSAYAGAIKPSWVNVGLALMADRRIGKAAVITVARQLGFAPNPHRVERGCYAVRSCYRQAREWLVEHRSAAFPVADATDGVVCQLQATPELKKLGVTVGRGLRIEDRVEWGIGVRKHIWLVRKGERTFHSEATSAAYAMRDAIRAWQCQDELAAKNREVVAFLTGEETGACPLIVREDSYRAGNCRPGTESWLQSHGWAVRHFLPGPALVAHLDDGRVMRVVQAARESLVRT